MPPCRAMKDLCLTCVQPSTNRKSDLTYIQEDLSHVRSSGSGSEYEDHGHANGATQPSQRSLQLRLVPGHAVMCGSDGCLRGHHDRPIGLEGLSLGALDGRPALVLFCGTVIPGVLHRAWRERELDTWQALCSSQTCSFPGIPWWHLHVEKGLIEVEALINSDSPGAWHPTTVQSHMDFCSCPGYTIADMPSLNGRHVP